MKYSSNKTFIVKLLQDIKWHLSDIKIYNDKIIGVEDKVHFTIYKFGLESTGSKPLEKKMV